MAFGVCTNYSSSFPPSTGQKWKFFAKKIDIVTIYNDEICYVKHAFDPLCVFSTLFDVWGGGVPRGLGHTCLCNFPASAAQKWKFPKLIFLILWPSKMIKYPM